MVVALWGLRVERILAAVEEELRRMGAETVVIDQADILRIDAQLTVDSRLKGWVGLDDRRIDFDEITAVYLRPYDARQVPAVAATGPGSAAWEHAGAVDDILWTWCELTPTMVVSRPSAMEENGSKPLQLAHIARCGFSVPDTLVTTDPGVARAFWERHTRVIYKSVSGVRSIVSSLQNEHLARLADIASCPVQLQQYVPGVDHRVHVVGMEVFACEVNSQAIDYRYPGAHDVNLRACRLPPEVEERCRRVAAEMNLPVAGIDLLRTHEDEWYCFEVNPSPGFTYYQDAAGLPIGAAIARLLAAAPSPSPRWPSPEPAAADNPVSAAVWR